MKKSIILGLLSCSILLAEQLTVLPINENQLSIENGGKKAAIEAYSDGLGAVFSSKVTLNNKALNELVFKYGEEAKKK